MNEITPLAQGREAGINCRAHDSLEQWKTTQPATALLGEGMVVKL